MYDYLHRQMDRQRQEIEEFNSLVIVSSQSYRFSLKTVRSPPAWIELLYVFSLGLSLAVAGLPTLWRSVCLHKYISFSVNLI